jgi:hypothetical protein
MCFVKSQDLFSFDLLCQVVKSQVLFSSNVLCQVTRFIFHSCNYHGKILRRSYKSTFIIFTIIGGTYICYFPAFVYYILCDITIEDACHYTTFANVKNICILLHGILYPIFYILRLKECQIIFFNIFCRFSQKLLDKAHRMNFHPMCFVKSQDLFSFDLLCQVTSFIFIRCALSSHKLTKQIE